EPGFQWLRVSTGPCNNSHLSSAEDKCESCPSSYIVPRASHAAVAGDACPGRVLTAERKVISWNSRITVEIATSCRTTDTMRTKSAKILIVYLPRLLAAVTQGSSFVENRRLIEASLSSRYFE